MPRDAQLDQYIREVESLEAEFQRARERTDCARSDMNRKWEEYKSLGDQYGELKELANREFEMSRTCFAAGDKYFAREHSINGKNLNERKNYLKPSMDNARAAHQSFKNAFQEAKAYQAQVLERLKAAREKKNQRLQEVKARNAEEASHWHEKKCQSPGCGNIIRYRDNWDHIPNFCRECKEKFSRERKTAR